MYSYFFHQVRMSKLPNFHFCVGNVVMKQTFPCITTGHANGTTSMGSNLAGSIKMTYTYIL